MDMLWDIIRVLGAVTLALSLLIATVILVALIAMTIGSLCNKRKDCAEDYCEPLVRCEFCKYSHRVSDPFNHKIIYVCDVHQHQVQQDGFCSSGHYL